jgi:multicomponent K+:H+ antiporter subunit E
MLHRVLPHSLLTLAILLVWMALANEVSAGAFVMGLVLGVLLPLVTRPFWPDRPLVGRPLKMLEYLFMVLWDIAVANVQVARLVLFVPNDRLRSRYVTVPLALRSPEAITVLAGTITMTPGTLSAELAADGGAILVHGLDVPDPEALVAEIKTRYEARLLEIFP